MMMEGVNWAVSNSDPANLMLLGVVWWRLDRRLRSLRRYVEDEGPE